MNYDLLYALIGFAFVTSITPGPNNLMLMASGANFGFRRSLSHMLGIGVGFTFMLILVGVGLIQIFDYFPASDIILKTLSFAYLVWLAWKTATASGLHPSDEVGQPMTVMQAAIFQWVNPKSWAMAVTAMTAFAPDRSFLTVLIVAATFGIINFPAVSIWTVLGTQIARFLTNHRRYVAFNVTMALALLATLFPLLWP